MHETEQPYFYAGVVTSKDDKEYKDTGSILTDCIQLASPFELRTKNRLLLDRIKPEEGCSYSIYLASAGQTLGIREAGTWENGDKKYRACIRKHGIAYATTNCAGKLYISDKKYQTLLDIDYYVTHSIPKYVVVDNSFETGKEEGSYCFETGNNLVSIMRYIPYIGDHAYIAFLRDDSFEVNTVSQTVDGDIGVTARPVDRSDVSVICNLLWDEKLNRYINGSGTPWIELLTETMEVTEE